MRLVAVLLTCVWLAACVASPPTTALTKDDPFRPYREIETEVFRTGTRPGTLAVKLVAQVDRKTAAATTLLKVHHHYSGVHRNNYESARNAKAEPLKFISVARYGQCRTKECPIDEMYMVEIPEADLKAAGSAGYTLKIFPRVGPDVLITVPPEMIKSILTLLDADRRTAAGSIASPAKKS